MSESTPKQIGKRTAPRSAWKPGQSGNPGGRPKVVADIRALAQAQGEDSIKALIAIRDDKKAPTPARVAAAKELLDRGYGRPHQSHDVRYQVAASAADDAALTALAFASGSPVALSQDDTPRSEGVVH